MEQRELQPFLPKTKLTGYYPVPRELLQMELSSTAILLYAVLLDRMTLSQKNRYVDAEGRVYVIYPIEKLAKTLSVSDTAVKRHLKQLEGQGLIQRQRPVGNGPNWITLCLPSGSNGPWGEGHNEPPQGAKKTRPTAQKVLGNNRRKIPNWNEYYEREEGEGI